MNFARSATLFVIIGAGLGALAGALQIGMSSRSVHAADSGSGKPTDDDILNKPAPELAGITDWQNSKPLKLADLKGKVVVLHFWTFGCINCQHNLPIYNAWQNDLAVQGVQILGVHTPETENEHNPENVAAEIKRRGVRYPVAVDSSGATWTAFHNHYWPAIYLIDKHGVVRFRWEGELEINDAHGDQRMRKMIEALRAEH